MNNKKAVRILAIILCVIMVLSLVSSIIPVIASADEDSMAELEARIAELQAKREEQQAQRASAEAKLANLREQQTAIIDLKLALEERNAAAAKEILLITEQIDELLGKIKEYDDQIKTYADMIESKAEDVEKARALEEQQYQRYRVRVRAMEESGGYNIIDLLLRADSLGDLLTSIEDMGLIMKQDKELEKNYIDARKAHEEVKAEYEEAKKELEARQQELEDNKKELEGKQTVLEEEKSGIEADIAESEASINELQDEIQKTEEEKAAAEAAEAAASYSILQFIAEYDRQKEEANRPPQPQQPQTQPEAPADPSGEGEIVIPETPSEGGDTPPADNPPAEDPQPQPEAPAEPEQPWTPPADPAAPFVTGYYLWPVPSSHRVSSCFKWRWGRQHTGVDIDGYGLENYPIVATDGGTVILADWYGGYGNCVIIDHGDGRKSLYAHMNSCAVWSGDIVSQGQTIGYLGSTGNSTGVHCHFEVILNGTQVDPLQFLSGYELEPGAAD